MDAKTLAYVAEAMRLVQVGLQVFALAEATLSRMTAVNSGDPITDADLAALKAKREEALAGLGKLIG